MAHLGCWRSPGAWVDLLNPAPSQAIYVAKSRSLTYLKGDPYSEISQKPLNFDMPFFFWGMTVSCNRARRLAKHWPALP